MKRQITEFIEKYAPTERIIFKSRFDALLKEHAIEFAEYLRMPKDVAEGEYKGWMNEHNVL